MLLPPFAGRAALPLVLIRTNNHLAIRTLGTLQPLPLVWTIGRGGKPAWASVVCQGLLGWPDKRCGRHARVLYNNAIGTAFWRCRWCHGFKYASQYPLQSVARADARLLRIEQQYGGAALPTRVQQVKADSEAWMDVADNAAFLRDMTPLLRLLPKDPVLEPILRLVKGKRFKR